MLWDILEMVNSQNGDYPDFALEGNAPVGSLNCTASRELGIDAFTIETSQKLPMEVRVSQQVLIVTNILQQYGMEFKLRPESGGITKSTGVQSQFCTPVPCCCACLFKEDFPPQE